MTDVDDELAVLAVVLLGILAVFVAPPLAGAAIAVLVSCVVQSEAS